MILLPVTILWNAAIGLAQAAPSQGADTTTDEAAAATTADAPPQAEPNADVDFLTYLGPIWEHNNWLNWTILFIAIFVGLVVGKVAQLILRGAEHRLTSRGWELRGLIFRDAASPASLALFTISLRFGLNWVNLGPRIDESIPNSVETFANKILQFLFILSIGWFIYNLVDLVDLGLRRITETRGKLAMQLVPLIRKALRIFVVVIFVLFIAQNVFEVNITAWLAGLGIAGLAVSLAAQDSIKNLFGSITVLLDKPFAVGDRISFNGADGFVEEIGFRSTKLRTFAGHLITVPNMKFIDGQVENVTARPFVRRSINVTITYDTPPEKIELAVKIIKDLLAEPEFAEPFNLEERPARVFFSDFNADSLNISVSYWYFLKPESKEGAGDARDWWTYMAHAEKFNHRLFRAYAEAGIDFAFPTQTVYLAGDPDRQLTLKLLSDGNEGKNPG